MKFDPQQLCFNSCDPSLLLCELNLPSEDGAECCLLDLDWHVFDLSHDFRQFFRIRRDSDQIYSDAYPIDFDRQFSLNIALCFFKLSLFACIVFANLLLFFNLIFSLDEDALVLLLSGSFRAHNVNGELLLLRPVLIVDHTDNEWVGANWCAENR